MDEATSSLDNETEQEVINSIQTLRGIKTLIVIAHRMSTIRHCNVIYKLEAGRVIANGSYEEVVELKKKEEIELYDNVGLPLHQ
ncbi:MAG: ABC transporter related protein [uncultured bacterium]|nr:MAG: ABC transporter related protein [uncultured bacterium]